MQSLKSCNITVMVSDMDNAVRFYTETLGLKLGQRYENHYAEIEAPGLRIGLHPASDKLVKGNNISIGLGTTDFEAALAELNAKGIETKVQQDDWGRIANFTDPDDNPFYLAELKN